MTQKRMTRQYQGLIEEEMGSEEVCEGREDHRRRRKRIAEESEMTSDPMSKKFIKARRTFGGDGYDYR